MPSYHQVLLGARIMPETKSTSRKPSSSKLLTLEQQTKSREALTQLRLDGDYPATLSALAERAGAAIESVARCLKTKGLKEQIVQLDLASSSIIVFKDDTDRLATDARVLDFFASNVLAKRTAEEKPLRTSLPKFFTDAKVPSNLKVAFKEVVEDRLKQNDLPSAIADLLEPQKPPKPIEIATRLFDVLSSQREASTNSYPVPLERLYQLAEYADLPDDARSKAIKHKAFADRVAYCGPRPGDASTSKSCILKSDLECLRPKLVQRAFEYAAATSLQKNAAGGRTTIFSAAELGAAMLVSKADKDLFAAQFDAMIDRAEPALALGWLEIKGKRQYFRLADVHSVGSTASTGVTPQPIALQPPVDRKPEAASLFAVDFDAAFRRIDARCGSRNFVKVYDLREELPQYDRAAFDTGLRGLREAGRFTMDSGQGGYSPLNDAERRAGIQEGSSLLVYVTRKSSS